MDAFVWNNAVQVVMERLSMHLDDYRKARPRYQLSIECIRSVAKQSLNGLAYLHEKGVTHRDMKPENILVATHNDTTNLPTIKLADFGFSSQRPELATRKKSIRLAVEAVRICKVVAWTLIGISGRTNTSSPTM